MPLHYTKLQTQIGFGTEKSLMWIAKRRLADSFDIDRLAKEVSHITGQREAQVKISFQYLIEAVEDAIRDGRSVDLGFGTISPAISCTAAATPDEVKITRKRVLFRASERLRKVAESIPLKYDADVAAADDDSSDETADPSADSDDIIVSGGDSGGGNSSPSGDDGNSPSSDGVVSGGSVSF